MLFLKYEELKQDVIFQVKRLDLEVNKTRKMPWDKAPSNKVYFRTDNVGDYVNYLNPSTVQRFSNILEEKLTKSGLTFKFS
ncbi:hypothetical protein SCA6_000908 [Theobroma cacao]